MIGGAGVPVVGKITAVPSKEGLEVSLFRDLFCREAVPGNFSGRPPQRTEAPREHSL